MGREVMPGDVVEDSRFQFIPGLEVARRQNSGLENAEEDLDLIQP